MVATALQTNLPSTSGASQSEGTANAAQLSTLGTQPTAAEQQRVSDLQEQ